jgi:hypothetical protein
VTNIYGMNSDKEFVSVLEDNICLRGAMSQLIIGRATAEVSLKIKDILRAYHIADWKSEPHHQHQNFAERHYGNIKSRTNVILGRTGAPPYSWLLCLQYVAYLYNHISIKSHDWKAPIQLLLGETSDIIVLLQFAFWEEAFFTRVNSGFPSESTEERGYFVGFAPHVGDLMTFQVLSKTTRKIIFRSNVHSVSTSGCPNYRLSTDGELDKDDYLSDDIPSKNIIQSAYNNLLDPPTTAPPTLVFQCSDLIDRSFLDSPCEDGTQHWVRITKAIADHIDTVNKHPDKVKFLLESSTGQYEKILTYLEVLNFLNDEDDHNIKQENGSLTKFKDIIGHQGPLTQQDTFYKGSKYNVQVSGRMVISHISH